MKDRLNIDELSQQLGWDESEIDLNRNAIETELHEREQAQSLPIKILSIFGGFMASITFSGFLFTLGIFDNESTLLFFGLLFLIGSVVFSRKVNTMLLDTMCVSTLLIGFILFGISLEQFHLADETYLLIICSLAIICISLVRNYIMIFVLVLVSCGTLLAAIVEFGFNNLAQLYIPGIGILLAYLYLKEGKIISQRNFLSIRYNPIRIALTFCLLFGLAFLTFDEHSSLHNYFSWAGSITFIGLCFVVLHRIFEVLSINNRKNKLLLYLLSLCCLLPCILYPALSGAIFLILLSFLVNYKTGFVLGILFLCYAVSRFYYDLDLTLLTKSIMMMVSGAFFLILYFVSLKISNHEKN